MSAQRPLIKALAAASPGIVVGPDGTPVLVDSNTGTLLDASNPAHSRARIQIFATGLGRVTPDWPAGKAAPVEDPPQVVATVTAYLDRAGQPFRRTVSGPSSRSSSDAAFAKLRQANEGEEVC